MKKRNEKTSPRVARIAAKVLNVATKIGHIEVTFNDSDYGPCRVHLDVTWSDIRALAASALTQAPNRKPKRKAPAKTEA